MQQKCWRTREKLEQLEARLAKLEALVLPAEPASRSRRGGRSRGGTSRSGPLPKTPRRVAGADHQPGPGRNGRPGSHRGVHLANGLPSLTLVGLPDTEVKESRERVRAAIQLAGFEFPHRRVTINLAPQTCLDSGRFDCRLPWAFLAASGQLSAQHLARP